MDINLEKTIAEYAKAALLMANLSEKEATVPEPEPTLSAQATPALSAADERQAVENDEGEAVKEVEQAVKESEQEENILENFEEEQAEPISENPAEDVTEPSFEDYISRRNRSWERGTNVSERTTPPGTRH